MPGSMEHTTKAAEGSCNRQSQQTSAIPRPTAPLFALPGECCQIVANGPLRDKESQPLLWQCINPMPRPMQHTTKAAEGSCNRQSQQTSAIPRPTAPLFALP